MTDIPFPRGVRDLLPNEALFRNELLRKVENVFRLFGFLTIDTPSFESLKVLKAKDAIGADTKLIYEMKDEQLGLRYDNTMSLARYIAMHQELPMPFKRYYIGKSWRREEPQRLRYREITQADADIIGGNRAMADAEVIAAAGAVLDSIGIKYEICINDRQLMDRVIEKFGVGKDKVIGVMRALDKFEKIGEDGVVKALNELGIESAAVDQIMEFVGQEGTNEDRMSYVEKLVGEDATKDLKTTLELLKGYGIRGEPSVDFSTVRGLDYYTGIVFEYRKMEMRDASLGGGGRYDNLIGIFSTKPMTAVGVALGIDRILEALDFSSSIEYTYAKVFIANVKEGNYKYAISIASAFRAKGVAVDMNMASRNLSNQLAYANAIKTKYVAIVGDSEEKMGKLKLRNLVDGNEETVSVDDAVKIVKGE
ncbi:MAG: histidine--tRNA ligase [Candidatus Micrarchaeota archaeon]|nr:histidine--tRNA ligase [Candidatus Micrarchaeota archaeon]